MFRLKSYQIIFISVIALTLYSCASEDPDRHLELAKWYNSKGLYDEAISEYREVIRLYPQATQNLSRQEYNDLSEAHYHLALMYTKKGWWEFALDAAESSFQLQPSNDAHELVSLIKRQIKLNDTSDSS